LQASGQHGQRGNIGQHLAKSDNLRHNLTICGIGWQGVKFAKSLIPQEIILMADWHSGCISIGNSNPAI
jgi:hypothetical protein